MFFPTAIFRLHERDSSPAGGLGAEGLRVSGFERLGFRVLGSESLGLGPRVWDEGWRIED